MQKPNSTDLHIRYKMETGEDFQWNPGLRSDHGGSGYHSIEGYSRDYCKWVEDQFLELLEKLKKTKDSEELLEYAQRELEEAYSKIEWLEEQVDYYATRDGGGQ